MILNIKQFEHEKLSRKFHIPYFQLWTMYHWIIWAVRKGRDYNKIDIYLSLHDPQNEPLDNGRAKSD